MEEISLIKIGMSVPNLPARSNPPSMRTVLLGYLPLRYTITAPIPSATMTNAKVSVLTSMGIPFVVCDGDSCWLFGLRGHRNTDYRHGMPHYLHNSARDAAPFQESLRRPQERLRHGGTRYQADYGLISVTAQEPEREGRARGSEVTHRHSTTSNKR